MSTILSSASTPTGATLPPTQGWLTDPLDPTTAVPLRRLKSSGSSAAPGSVSFQGTTTEEMGSFAPFGRKTALVQRSGVLVEAPFTLSFLQYGYAEMAALVTLKASGHTLLWRSDMGEAFYIVLGDLPRSILRDSARVTNPLIAISVVCTVVDPP